MQQQAADEQAWARCHTEHTLQLLYGKEARPEHPRQHSTVRNQQSLVTRLNGMLYELHTDKDHPRGCWRRTSMHRYREPSDTWTIIIDFDQLSEAEGTGWLPYGLWSLPPNHEKALIQMRDDAGSRYILREWNLQTGVPVGEQEFSRTGCTPSEVAWLDDNTVLLTCRLDQTDDWTLCGQARRVRLWERGTAAERAPVVFEVPKHHVSVRAFRDWGSKDERIVYVDEEAPITIAIHVGPRDESPRQLPIPTTAACVLRGEYIAIRLRENWVVNEETHRAGMMVGCSMHNLLVDAPQLVTLCDASGLQEALMDRDRLITLFCHNFQYSIRVFWPNHSWSEPPTRSLPAGQVMSIATLDCFASETDDTLLLTSQGPLNPPTLWLSPIPGGRYDWMRQAPETFRANDYTLTDDCTTNGRGESISYTLVAPNQSITARPVCYIMCTTDLLPDYSTVLGRNWIEPGGVVVFVPSGYGDAESAFLDVTSIAVKLVIDGFAQPNRSAILGAYEHGAALVERYPISDHVFGAFCAYNPRWPSPAAFPFAGRHIGSHAGAFKPSLLIGCNDSSDSADIRRARQIGAKLQQFRYETYYYESQLNERGGVDSPEDLLASQLRFLGRKIGWAQETAPEVLHSSG